MATKAKKKTGKKYESFAEFEKEFFPQSTTGFSQESLTPQRLGARVIREALAEVRQKTSDSADK